MATEPARGRSRWDAAIVVLGMIAGAWSQYVAHSSAPRGLSIPRPLSWVLAEGLVFGLAWAGPVVLAVQWARGRRERLRLGEWLWVIPPILRLAVMLLVSFARAGGHSVPVPALVFATALSFGTAVTALVALFVQRSRRREWTETVGCLSCVLDGALLVALFLWSTAR